MKELWQGMKARHELRHQGGVSRAASHVVWGGVEAPSSQSNTSSPASCEAGSGSQGPSVHGMEQGPDHVGDVIFLPSSSSCGSENSASPSRKAGVSKIFRSQDAVERLEGIRSSESSAHCSDRNLRDSLRHGSQPNSLCTTEEHGRHQVAHNAAQHDEGAASSSQAADANSIPAESEAAPVEPSKKERLRPRKAKRMQGKLLAEIVFRAQNDTLERKERAEALFLNETLDNPALLDYASKVLLCLRSEASKRSDRGEDPALTAARLFLPGGEPLLDANSDLPIEKVYHEFVNKLALNVYDGDGDAAVYASTGSAAFGMATDVAVSEGRGSQGIGSQRSGVQVCGGTATECFSVDI